MTKTRIIVELLHAVYNALDAQLTESRYEDFLRGSVSFRLELMKPTKVYASVNLPTKTTPKKLEIKFVRPYTRRQVIPAKGAA